MYGQNSKRSIRRVMVTILTLVLLVGLVTPGLQGSAEGEAWEEFTLQPGRTVNTNILGPKAVEITPADENLKAVYEGNVLCLQASSEAQPGDHTVLVAIREGGEEVTLQLLVHVTAPETAAPASEDGGEVQAPSGEGTEKAETLEPKSEEPKPEEPKTEESKTDEPEGQQPRTDGEGTDSEGGPVDNVGEEKNSDDQAGNQPEGGSTSAQDTVSEQDVIPGDNDDMDSSAYQSMFEQIMICEDEEELAVLAGKALSDEGFVAFVESLDSDTQTAFYEKALPEQFKNIPLAEVSVNEVSIRDTIKTDGRLMLVAKDETGAEISAQELIDAGYTISWQKDEVEVERKEVTDNVYNLGSDGAWVNVVYDKGAQAAYTVTVTKGGETVSGNASVNYYDELQNPSFEQPEITAANDSGWTGIAQIAEGNVPGWRTTASDHKIEIGNVTIKDSQWGGVVTNSGTQKWYNCGTAVDGDQIAELNCESAGALYQDVLTEPGSTMYWKLSHRGRTGNDTMALVIAPLNKVENITTQDALTEFIGDHGNDSDVFVWRMTDGNTAWGNYDGRVVVPDDQYVTRFFFVAISAAGGVTQGNLLDDVWFSTEVPPPVPGNGSITVTKNIYGLTLAQVQENESLNRIISYTGNAEGDVIFTGWQQKQDNEGASYITATAVVNVSNLSGDTTYSYTFTEDSGKAEVSGYDMAASDVSLAATVKKEANVAAVTFTNTYTKKVADVTITKQVTGNMGDYNKSFAFRVTCGQAMGEGADYTLSDDGKTATFDLSHNQSITLVDVPIGETLSIQETGADAYTMKVDDVEQESHTYTCTVVSGKNAVTIENYNNITVPTGIVTDSAPYVVLLTLAVLGGGVLLWKRRGYGG